MPSPSFSVSDLVFEKPLDNLEQVLLRSLKQQNHPSDDAGAVSSARSVLKALVDENHPTLLTCLTAQLQGTALERSQALEKLSAQFPSLHLHLESLGETVRPDPARLLEALLTRLPPA